MNYSFHRAIGDLFGEEDFKGFKIVKDTACGGSQHLPLFSGEKSFETRLCDVDLLMIDKKTNKVKLIMEIEESDVKPNQICGKFLTSTLANCYYPPGEKNPIGMDESLLFIQILNTEKIEKDKSKKIKQWKLLEQLISGLLPGVGSHIGRYRLFYGSESDFREGKARKELMESVKEFLC
ncbi:hypothetical protein KGY73_11485 [bacterium]|nr:hypothetical protein [bacterium]